MLGLILRNAGMEMEKAEHFQDHSGGIFATTVTSNKNK